MEGLPRNLRDPDASAATSCGTAEQSASERGRGGGKSERRSTSDETGELTRRTPSSKERRRVTEPLEGKMTETPSSSTVSTRLERIAKLAREAPGMALTTLAHHIDIAWLHEAFQRTRKDGATGEIGRAHV